MTDIEQKMRALLDEATIASPSATEWAIQRLALRRAIEQHEAIEAQIDRLASFIMHCIEGEPSQSQGAVDTAIRIMTEQATTIGEQLAEIERLRAVLSRWQYSGCPDCSGDCGSANPPVMCCIMEETRAALGEKQ